MQHKRRARLGAAAAGALALAAELHRRTLDIRRRTLGPEHPDTLTSHSSLAAALAALDRPTGPAA